jgi:hypothetical protein
MQFISFLINECDALEGLRTTLIGGNLSRLMTSSGWIKRQVTHSFGTLQITPPGISISILV